MAISTANTSGRALAGEQRIVIRQRRHAGELGREGRGPGGAGQDWPGYVVIRLGSRSSSRTGWRSCPPAPSGSRAPGDPLVGGLRDVGRRARTVEKIELLSVVTLPSGPRYGCIAQSTLSPTVRVPAPSAIVCEIGARSTPTTSPTSCARSPSGPPSAAEAVDHRLHLLIRRAIVDEDHLAPVAFEDVPGDMRHGDQRQPAHVDPADRAGRDVVGDDRVTVPLSGSRRSSRGKACRSCIPPANCPRAGSPGWLPRGPLQWWPFPLLVFGAYADYDPLPGRCKTARVAPVDGRRPAAEDDSLRPGRGRAARDLIAPPYDVIDDEQR